MRIKDYTKEELLANKESLVHVRVSTFWGSDEALIVDVPVLKTTEKQMQVRGGGYSRVPYMDVGLLQYNGFYCLKQDAPALLEEYKIKKLANLRYQINQLENEIEEVKALSIKEEVN